MLTQIFTWLIDVWEWSHVHDLPNWFAFGFTVVLWPLALFLWQRRKVNGVAGLEVHFSDGQITINGNPYAAIDLQFTNHTGAVAYIHGVRIRSCSKMFPVPIEASRDIAENSYHLKFMDSNGAFVMREVTLQTSQFAKTCMPTLTSMNPEFFTHTPSWLSRHFSMRKYFILECTAMVGNARYSVAMRY